MEEYTSETIEYHLIHNKELQVPNNKLNNIV